MPHIEIQQALKIEKQNASKLFSLKYFNEELLSVAEVQHWQLGVHAQSFSTEPDIEAGEHEVVSPKTTTALAKIANISPQHVVLLRTAIFDTMPDTVNVRRGAASHSLA